MSRSTQSVPRVGGLQARAGFDGRSGGPGKVDEGRVEIGPTGNRSVVAGPLRQRIATFAPPW